MKPRNTLRVTIDKNNKEELLTFYALITSYSRPKRQYAKDNHSVPIEAVKYLKSIYDEGYGIKVLARELGLTYSRMRALFEYCDIEIRRGYGVSTEVTRKFRSESVSGDKNPWYDWCNNRPEMHKKVSRGIQGKFTRMNGDTVWLRSTWEFIFARWLDKNGIDWLYEGRQYKLSNGEGYRPDFILLENGKEKYVIEIKGYFKNRMYKVDLLRKDYPELKIIVINKITDYCKDYKKELNEWRCISKSNEHAL
jgi:hypothetical protein